MKTMDFIKKSGFKILAVTKFDEVQYSIIFYILNTSSSGLDHIITNGEELSELLEYPYKKVVDALYSLSDMNVIKMSFSDTNTSHHEHSSMRLCLNLEPKKWILGSQKDMAKDAIVFPFKRFRLKDVNAKPEGEEKKHSKSDDATWERIVECFVRNRHLDDDELKTTEKWARTLIETHPVDQILLLINYFGQRIPTLSLLASTWAHFQETYLEEHHNIDLLGARKKHQELDEKLRTIIEKHIDETEEIPDDDLQILEMLKNHKHPRRQLYWAYQARAKYPSLSGFFDSTKEMMLAVTSSGAIHKKNT